MTTPATQTPGGDTTALCSVVSARVGLPLIGSAGCFDRILAFELEAPWTPRLAGSRAGDAALDAAIVRISAEARGLRLLAVEPRGGEDSRGLVRVLAMERGAEPFRAYSKREFEVPTAELASALDSLAFASGPVNRQVAGSEAGRDILVCTHGARDACCGKFGYPLYREFVAQAAPAGSDAARIWRCSHLGGHRFAPTVLDLPSGRMFGRMTIADARVLLTGGEGLLARIPAIYRGRSALPEPAQIVERDLWLQQGAAFEGAALNWTVQQAEGAWMVEIEAASPSLRVRARVVRSDAAALAAPASCGRDPETDAPWQIVARG